MGNQSASRREGDSFQDLYSCYEVLQLLDPHSSFDHAWLENPDAGSADDLTLHAKPGSEQSSRFIQVKWHVDHRDRYSVNSLVKKDGRQSLLGKLFASWRKIREREPAEIWLVSNWQADDDLRGFVRARDHALTNEFFADNAMKVWQEALGASPEDVESFCRSLRLWFGFDSIETLKDRINDRMRSFGLPVSDNARTVLCDEIRTRIELGGSSKRIDRDELLKIVKKRGLEVSVEEAQARENKPKVSLWIHGWAYRAYEEPPTIELDWTRHFDRDERRVPDQETWERTLFPELKEAKRLLSRLQGGSFIDFRAKLPLSATLAVGFTFPEVGGYSFRTEQPVSGEIFLWASNTPPLPERKLVEVPQEGQEAKGGRDVLIVFSITGDAFGTTRKLRERLDPTLADVCHIMPDGGPGGTSIRSAGDATALAQEAKEVLRKAHNRFPGCRKHLVVYSPAAFSLFLGMKLNALGEILTYEMNAAGDDYQSSVLLRTN